MKTIKLNAMLYYYDREVIILKSGEPIKAVTVLWSTTVIGDLIPGHYKEWKEKIVY